MFKKYQHIERFGTPEVDCIEYGKCYIFPKIDGTNASVWLDKEGNIQAGSRRRRLTENHDNAGFRKWALAQDNFKKLFKDFPHVRLFGEWLVPHSLKTYRNDAWRKFYVFDVTVDNNEDLDYISYDNYKDMLEKYNIDYIPPICTIERGDLNKFNEQLKENVFLIEDGKGYGEGIVIKNYDFKNKYGRTIWAKIVTSEFKEKHAKEMGAPNKMGGKVIEEDIVCKYVTTALIEKEYSKILVEVKEWSTVIIPRLLSTVYYSLIKEECWNFIKEHKQPKVDFKRLCQLTNIKIKELKPEYFKKEKN